MKPFGETIRSARLERGWSLREASANIGISHTYLSALENGADPRTGKPIEPSSESLMKICNAYSLPYETFSHPFRAVNESDVIRFLIGQLREIRKNDRRLYKKILAEAEKDLPNESGNRTLK